MLPWPTPTGFRIKDDEDVWINSSISASVSGKSVSALVSGKYKTQHRAHSYMIYKQLVFLISPQILFIYTLQIDSYHTQNTSMGPNFPVLYEIYDLVIPQTLMSFTRIKLVPRERGCIMNLHILLAYPPRNISVGRHLAETTIAKFALYCLL